MLHVSHWWYAALALLPVSYYSGTLSERATHLKKDAFMAEREKGELIYAINISCLLTFYSELVKF